MNSVDFDPWINVEIKSSTKATKIACWIELCPQKVPTEGIQFTLIG